MANTATAVGRECENCGQTSTTVLDRQHGVAECAPCYLASLEHGRQHVSESFERAYVVIGFTADQHVYTEAIDADCASDALMTALADCDQMRDAGGLDVDTISIKYAPIV